MYIQPLENQLCIWYLMCSLQVIYGRLFLETNKNMQLKNNKPKLYFGKIKAKILVISFVNSVLAS